MMRECVVEAVGVAVGVPPDAHAIEFERDEEQPPVTLYPVLIDPYLPMPEGGEDDSGDAEDTPPGRHSLLTGLALPSRRHAGLAWRRVLPSDGPIRLAPPPC